MPLGTSGLRSQARHTSGWSDKLGLLGRTRVRPQLVVALLKLDDFSRRDGQKLQWFGTYAMWYALGSACALDDSGRAWRHHMVGLWDESPSECTLTIPSVRLLSYGHLRTYVVAWRLGRNSFISINTHKEFIVRTSAEPPRNLMLSLLLAYLFWKVASRRLF